MEALSDDDRAATRASATCLCWKRLSDLPPDLRMMQGMFQASTDPNAIARPVRLSYSAVFPPANMPLRGVVVFLHGINEHSERYAHAWEALCGLGFGVIAYDLRSHGNSYMDVGGLRAHVEYFQEFVDDTNDFITFAKTEILPKMRVAEDVKLVIMGMSLGTLVSVHTVLSGVHTFSGIVLVAPAVSAEMTFVLRVMKLISGVLRAVAPRARLVPGVNADYVCRDPLVNKDYDADPLTTREKLTCRIASEVSRAMERLDQDRRVESATSAFCQVPILFMMGAEDKVTSVPEAQRFYRRLASPDKQFEMIDGAYHVLFEDLERERVLNTIEHWLHKRFELPN